ncbi:MAG: YqgE/AlgH family protein [Verrucomicrobia bacterium]|nr:YqgE/AlgH family protein [Verrucomicrobiota bacterium]
MAGSHQSLKGQFLLDGGKLKGSFFHRTVVLVCQHDPEGAFGLVLNKPLGKPAEELIPEDLPASIKSEEIFLGGPVQPSALTFLHTYGGKSAAAPPVFDHLRLGHSLEELVEIGERKGTSARLRLFAGYAGWSPMQLDNEMKRGSWLTYPANVELMFETPPDELWKRVLKLKGWRFELLAQAPEDDSLN